MTDLYTAASPVATAHRLHERGFHVFPTDHPDQPKCIGLHHPQKNPCDGQRAKHPAVKFGIWAKTVTDKMIDLEWRKHRGLANIGIACGPSGIVVLDEDKDGELARWAVTYGVDLPDTYTVNTGRGKHLYFSWDHSIERIGLVPKAVDGFALDVRGDGGYVIAEGSQHASGAIYTGSDMPVVPLPQKVAAILLAAQSKPERPADDSCTTHSSSADRNTDRIGFRERHNRLVAYAGRLRKTGLDYREALPVFRQRWLLCEQPEGQIPEAKFHSTDCPYPVTWDEAVAKLRDVFDRYAPGQDLDGTESIENTIQQRLAELRINREARRRLDDEEHPPVQAPPVLGLGELLAEPDEPCPYRIAQVAPADARILLSAQYKAGKTTLVGNLIRSLVDGEPFLGRFTVSTPAKRVVLIDDELSKRQLRQWLRDQNITNTSAVADVISLRGRVGSFNLLDDRQRGQWVKRLTDLGCDYLILDCLRPVLDALGLDENSDAGRFLVPFDALLADAGIPDALVVQHMGHSGERSRGDSRLQDWPDALWRLVREEDDPASPRFFSAYGRDVDVAEGRLGFDPKTRRLTYSPGSRQDAKTEAALKAVIYLLAGFAKDGGEPMSGRGIEGALSLEHSQKSIRDGIKKAVEGGFVTITEGPRRAKLHAISHPCAECGMPVADRSDRHRSCSAESEGLFQ
jgi:hypothetical protein